MGPQIVNTGDESVQTAVRGRQSTGSRGRHIYIYIYIYRWERRGGETFTKRTARVRERGLKVTLGKLMHRRQQLFTTFTREKFSERAGKRRTKR